MKHASLNILTAFIFLFAVFSCVDEDRVGLTGNTAELRLYVPASATVSTRAMTEEDESAVKDLYVLVFDDQDKCIEVQKVTVIMSDPTNPALKTVSVVLKNGESMAGIVSLANLDANNIVVDVNGWLNHSKSTILNNLQYQSAGQWQAGGGNASRPFPMYGAYEGEKQNSITINLLRALARINVMIEEEGQHFTLTDVTVHNSLNAGFVAPVDNMNFAEDGNVLSSSIPANAKINTDLKYVVPSASAALFEKEIYIPEAVTTGENGVYFTLGGTINAIPKLYRVYLTEDGTKEGKSLSLLRNHTYNIKINKVGTGENDLTVEIEPMSDMPIRSPYEQNTLTVSSNLFYFYPGHTTPATLTVSTTWKSWRISPDDQKLDGFVIERNPANKNQVIITPTNVVGGGHFYIESGQLKKKILVKVDPEETSNCYIRTETGDYPLLVTVKGNGRDGQYADNVQLVSEDELKLSPTRLGIIWETAKGLVTLGADKRQAIDIEESENFDGIVYYHVDLSKSPQGGNALIGAFRDGVCIWSWHIWVVPDYYSAHTANHIAEKTQTWATTQYTFLDRYIGALSSTYGVGSLGLLYQWGRKDPFIGAGELSKSPTSAKTYNYDPCGKGRDSYFWKISAQVTHLDQSIQNPTTLSTTGLCAEGLPQSYWGTNSGMKMVGDNANQAAVNEGNKTIYDPCPVGYRVPPVLAFIFGKGKNSSYYTNYSANNNWVLHENPYYFGFDINTLSDAQKPGKTGTAWFPLSGVYDPANDSFLQGVEEGELSYYNGFSSVDGLNSITVNSIVWTNTPIGVKDGDKAAFRPGALFLHGADGRNGRHLHAINENGESSSDTGGGAANQLYAQTQFAGSVRCVKIEAKKDFQQYNKFPQTVTLDAKEGIEKSETITVINETWEVVNPGATWFYLDKYSGNPDGGAGQTLKFVTSETNETGRERRAVLAIKTQKGSAPVEITVIQPTMPYDFTATPNQLSFTHTGGTSYVDVSFSRPGITWKASTKSDWVQTSQENGRLKVVVVANSSTQSRKATLTITDSNNTQRTVSVVQEAAYKNKLEYKDGKYHSISSKYELEDNLETLYLSANEDWEATLTAKSQYGSITFENSQKRLTGQRGSRIPLKIRSAQNYYGEVKETLTIRIGSDTKEYTLTRD